MALTAFQAVTVHGQTQSSKSLTPNALQDKKNWGEVVKPANPFAIALSKEFGRISKDTKESEKIKILKTIKEVKKTKQVMGGVGDGGGTGMACFYQNRLTPNFPADVKDANGRLTPYYRNSMNQFMVTDDIDKSAINGVRTVNKRWISPPEYPTENDTPESYLDRIVIQRVQPLAPHFAALLKTALYNVRRETWIPVPEGLSDTADLGDSPQIESQIQEGCTTVQIIRRIEIYNPISGVSTVQAIEYDPDLIEKLRTVTNSSLGQKRYETLQLSILLLHEALYSVATSLDHSNSVKVRALAKTLMDENLTHTFKNNFQFLYLLYAHDFLNSSYFGYDPENNPENSGEFTRLALFGEILKRIAEHSRDELIRKGFDCDIFEEQWPDLNCKIQGLQLAMNPYSSFFTMDTDIYSFFSEDEFRNFSDVFSFLWTIPSRNDHPCMSMKEWKSDGAWGSIWPETMLEDILIKGRNDSAVIKTMCPIIAGRLEANHQASGPWFSRHQSRNLKLQEIFLQKAVRYCRSKSAL